MAKTKARSAAQRRSAKWPWILLIIIGAALAAGWYYREPAQNYAQVATSYSARVACSCRFVAGREISDCAKDKLEGMELVSLDEDADNRSVTARFPLIASDTATYREGFGCVLEPWDG